MPSEKRLKLRFFIYTEEEDAESFGGSEGSLGNVIESTLKCACARVFIFSRVRNISVFVSE